jgi:hypothetical protein
MHAIFSNRYINTFIILNQTTSVAEHFIKIFDSKSMLRMNFRGFIISTGNENLKEKNSFVIIGIRYIRTNNLF